MQAPDALRVALENPCMSMIVKTTLLLQDNLRLGKKLATGGFGTVFKADLTDDEDPNDVRSVIVKKVSPDASQEWYKHQVSALYIHEAKLA